MHFISEALEQYTEQHSQDEPQLLAELNRETHQKILQPRMLSGHLQGRVLSMLSKLVRPQHILEIGTYTGYATLCLAEGLSENGTIDTIDNNEELFDFQRKYFDRSPWKAQIFQHLGNALEIIPGLGKKYDLVFVDADPIDQPEYVLEAVRLLRPGGVVVVHRAALGGRAGDPTANDAEVIAVREAARLIAVDERLTPALIPLGDGLLAAVRD